MHLHVSESIAGVMEQAVAASVRRGQFYVGVEHLYAAILDDAGALPEAFREGWLNSLFSAHREMERHAWTGNAPSTTGEIFHTPRAIDATQDAGKLADRAGNGSATTGHLLLAILLDDLSAPSRAMDTLQLRRGECVRALREQLARPRSRVRAHQHAELREADALSNDTPAVARSESSTSSTSLSPAPDSEVGESTLMRSLTRDLSRAARHGELSPAVGRKTEIMELLQILSRKTKNNAILVGEAGVGKTQLVEGLALKMAQAQNGSGAPSFKILELNLATLMAGTQYRGAFEERLLALLDKLRASKDLVLFIDEIHLIMGAGSTDGDGMDLANLLKPPLARGEIRCIGATTLQEYRKFVEKDPAIERRFQMVRVEELDEPSTMTVLERLRPQLERHHQVRIARASLEAAVSLTQRYMPNRYQPDKAIDVLDQACARHRLKAMAMDSDPGFALDYATDSEGQARVTPHCIRKVISQMTSIPLEELTQEERRRIGGLEKRIKERLIGQDAAVSKAVAAVKKSRAGLADPNRPDAVLLFLGPSGVGKTQLAKLVAEYVFGAPSHLLTFDMSEYIEEHSVAKLLGAPPGYAGHEEEGRLTGVVRNQPFSLLLFDEIEKAHPRIYDIFLPIFDEGRLKDTRGRDVNFRNCIIVMTSNIGADVLSRDDDRASRGAVMAELRKHFRPELINRIDEIVPFFPLLAEDVRSILRLEVNALRMRLRDKKVGIRMYQMAYEYLASLGYSQEFGAREIRRVVEREVAGPVSELVLSSNFTRGDMIDVLMEEGALVVRMGEPHPDRVEASS